MKASGSAPSAPRKSKQTQKPIFVESEGEDSDEMTDFSPLQVRYPDSKEQSESDSIEEVDFSTDEDTEAEWEHIFTGHTSF